jgi:hypothetical protein
MQKKSLKKKISLHRESLLRLESNQLEQVAGGDPTVGASACFCTDTCTLMPRCH